MLVAEIYYYKIIGEGGGGAVANLLAKKLIDKYGSDRVYSYTFQALNTINIMDIPEGNNAKYQSIFNVINEDDYIMVLENENMNMTKYGVIKKFSVGNDKKGINRWNKNKGIFKTYTGSYKKAKEVVRDIVNYDKDVEVVVGFGLSEMVMSIKNVLQVIRYYCTKAEYIVDDSYIEDMTYEEQTVGKNIQVKNSVEYKQTSDQASGNAGYKKPLMITDEYMWYIGLDDIWETDMRNAYSDTNVCRYALGHRDVVYSLGKTQNVTRNVIAISIGDIAEKAATLYG